MSDPELKELLSQLVITNREQQERFAEEKAAHAAALLEAQERADARFAQLIGSMQRPGPVNVQYNHPEPAEAVIRAEKVQKKTLIFESPAD